MRAQASFALRLVQCTSLVAGLAWGATSLAAPLGVGITPAEQRLVSVGMSQDAVRGALGRPAQVIQYRNETGPTWTYDLHKSADGGPDLSVFDIAFGPDGRVLAARERAVDEN